MYQDIVILVLQGVMLYLANAAESSGNSQLPAIFFTLNAIFALALAARAGTRDESETKMDKWPYIGQNLIYIVGIVVSIWGVQIRWWLSIIAVIQGMTLVHFWNHVEMDDY